MKRMFAAALTLAALAATPATQAFCVTPSLGTFQHGKSSIGGKS